MRPSRRSVAPRARPGKAACASRPALLAGHDRSRAPERWPVRLQRHPADGARARRRVRPAALGSLYRRHRPEFVHPGARRPFQSQVSLLLAVARLSPDCVAANTRWSCRRRATIRPTRPVPAALPACWNASPIPGSAISISIPKEQHNYLTRKLAYVEAFQLGMRNHLGTFKCFPPKKVMGIKVADTRSPSS